MITDEFIEVYWSQYILIEKEFMNTINYVSLSTDNYETYSNAYLKLLLQIGSEIDVIFQLYCKLLDSNFSKEGITNYKECIQEFKPDFICQDVNVIANNVMIQPWEKWNYEGSPYWWIAYNKIKHCRFDICKIDGKEKEGYKFVNQEYTVHALAALYQILIYFYFNLACKEGKREKTPLPGSRMFRLTGSCWINVNFYFDCAFHIDEDGYLIYETGKFPY